VQYTLPGNTLLLAYMVWGVVSFFGEMPKMKSLAKGPNKMNSLEFSTACLFRLGCKFPFISDSLRCTCGNKQNTASAPLIGECGEHLHVCNVGNERIKKHDALVRTLDHLAHYAGIKTILEPTGCSTKSDSNMRPDIKLIQPSYNNECRHDIVVDISVTHPCTTAKINNNNTDKNRGKAAHMSEMKKKNDYTKQSLENGMHFMPLIVETHGRWGKELTQFFETNVTAGWRKNGQVVPLSLIKEYWKKRISFTLQLMNARMFLYRVQHIIHKTSGGRKLDESLYTDTIRNSRVRSDFSSGF
jgi:hypothetical protein